MNRDNGPNFIVAQIISDFSFLYCSTSKDYLFHWIGNIIICRAYC